MIEINYWLLVLVLLPFLALCWWVGTWCAGRANRATPSAVREFQVIVQEQLDLIRTVDFEYSKQAMQLRRLSDRLDSQKGKIAGLTKAVAELDERRGAQAEELERQAELLKDPRYGEE